MALIMYYDVDVFVSRENPHPSYRCRRGWRVADDFTKNGMLPYSPILRKGIVAQLNDYYGGGLALPDGSCRPLQLSLTRKEQISARINDAHGKLTNPSPLTNPRIRRS